MTGARIAVPGAGPPSYRITMRAMKGAAFALALLAALPARADDWPHWRGPARNGISAETGWLDRWPEGGPTVLWKAEIGTGFSSFAVAGGRCYTTGHADEKDTVFCFDAETGRLLWKHSYPAELGDNFFEGGTTATPTVEGGRVYTLSRWGDALCFEAATGKVVWSRNVQKETGARIPDWGYSGSPVPFENLLLLTVGEAGLALDKATGAVAWKSGEKDAGYSTPLPIKHAGRDLALVSSGLFYHAVDPRTGKEAWRFLWKTAYGVNSADPVVDADRVFISSGYEKGAALLRLGAGDPEVVWESKAMRNQMNPCVLLEGYLYGCDGNAGKGPTLKCIEFATGAEMWTREAFGNGTVAAAGGKLIALAESGELMIAPASPREFKPTARAKVVGGKCWTVPVLANGRIYIRNAEGDVVCLDVRKK